MLGGEKSFNDRLAWVLLLPLALMALWAVDIAFLGLELLFEGDDPGSATWWVAPLMSLGGGFAAIRMGASVAPYRKLHAALAVAALFALATLGSAIFRWQRGASSVWCLAFSGLGLLGAGAACRIARGLPDDEHPSEGKDLGKPSPGESAGG